MKRISFAILAAALVLATACKENGTGPKPAPVPTITSVSPGTVPVRSTGVSLTVTGTGFGPTSRIWWNTRPLTTTVVSASEMRAEVPDELLHAGGPVRITAFTPQPGGGTSEARTVTVSYLAPAITGFSVDTILAGKSLPVTVTGTGFTPETRILWGGQEQVTHYKSSTEVSFQAPASVDAGVVQVAVRNPQPGGGTSAGRPFSVLNPVPVVLLPARGATAGRAGFTLTVHGSGFAPSAVLTVNGQQRGATWVSNTRMQVPISSADVAAPGTLTVRVVNGGPVARSSNTATMTVRSLGAGAERPRYQSMRVNGIVWDPRTARLYVSLPSRALNHANSIAAIDPTTGAVTGSVVVGREPNRLALSDDGQYLYVGLDGENAVRRVDVAGLTPGLQWSLGAGMTAGDIAVVPGQPRSVAVAVYNGFSPPLQGVRLYKDGVAQGTASPGHTGGQRIEFLESESLLYGYSDGPFENFYTMEADSLGVRHRDVTHGLVRDFGTDILGAADRIYASDGAVIDAERRVKVGTLSVDQYVFGLTADPEAGRVYMLTPYEIRVHDMNTFQVLGSIPLVGMDVPHSSAIGTTRLVRWGTDGLAFHDEAGLYIVRGPLIGP